MLHLGRCRGCAMRRRSVVLRQEEEAEEEEEEVEAEAEAEEEEHSSRRSEVKGT